MKSTLIPLTIAVAFALLGCATPAQKRVDKAVKQESGVSSQAELYKKGHQAILNSPGATKEQREKMLSLYSRTGQEIAAIRSEMGKLKGVLFRNLMNPKSKETDLNVIKRRLSRLNQRKLDVMFDALADSRKILGKLIIEQGLVPILQADGSIEWVRSDDYLSPHVMDQKRPKKKEEE